jgi:hypothetical protein
MPAFMQSAARAAITSAPLGADTIVESSSPDLLLPGKSAAAVEGALVVGGFRAGVRAVIEACVRTAESIRRFQDDPSAIDDFLAALVEGNVISRSEARLGLSSPKLSKFRTIGDHAELLCSDEILSHPEPGYTIPYQAVVLFNVLAGDEHARFEQLVKILQAEPVSRERLIAQTEMAKRAKRSSTAGISEFNPEGAREDIGNGIKVSKHFDLLLADLNLASDLRHTEQNYGDHPPLCLRIRPRVAEDAVAVVIARLADIPTIENKLLPRWGFGDVARVLLLRDPVDPDVTDAQVVVIATRGRREIDQVGDLQWLPYGEPLDAVGLAARLVPDAKSKLHLFATQVSEGWCSIVGEANWRDADLEAGR